MYFFCKGKTLGSIRQLGMFTNKEGEGADNRVNQIRDVWFVFLFGTSFWVNDSIASEFASPFFFGLPLFMCNSLMHGEGGRREGGRGHASNACMYLSMYFFLYSLTRQGGKIVFG
jgi:hypothetical protein